MSSKTIGVEIGNATIKLAVCSGSKVTRMAVERLPEGLVREGRVTAPAAMSQFIRQMRKRYGIPGGTCALVLPGQAIIGRMVSMPVMAESELQFNLPYEFRDFIGKESGKYTYDYSVVSVKDNVMEMYAAAVPTELVEEYYGILKKAGLKLKAAMPAEMAWLNLIRKAKNEPKKLCIVDIGSKFTRVNIFSDDHYVMGKDIEIAGATIDDAIVNAEGVDPYVARSHKESNIKNVLAEDFSTDIYAAIAIEVMKIINYYCSSTPDGVMMQDIYFSGGSSAIEALRTAILKRTDFSVHHVRRLVACDAIDDTTVMFCALAAGAGMQLQ